MSKTAFVAMKFNKDPWNDKKYGAISEVLREAGYASVRADQIRTSGAAVEELSTALSEADVVVVDISGQSHNVSYELGFCHGSGRDPATLVLICDENDAIPFNYAHFRRYTYKDLRHLRRLLRYRLDISTPLGDAQMAYAFCFTPASGSDYGSDVAGAVVESLFRLKFSGRCEYYAGELLVDEPNRYVVGLALRQSLGKKPTAEWWRRLKEEVIDLTDACGEHLHYDDETSEFVEVGALRMSFPLRGVTEFHNGTVARILNHEEETASWFLMKVAEKMHADDNADAQSQ